MNVTTPERAAPSHDADASAGTESKSGRAGDPRIEDNSLPRLRGRVGEGAHVESMGSAGPHPAGDARRPPPQAGEVKQESRDPSRRQGPQQKRERRDVHGWVVLDKPVGMTSTHAVAVVKRLFNAKRAGHAGTLDPLA